jgi:hypothetical protein
VRSSRKDSGTSEPAGASCPLVPAARSQSILRTITQSHLGNGASAWPFRLPCCGSVARGRAGRSGSRGSVRARMLLTDANELRPSGRPAHSAAAGRSSGRGWPSAYAFATRSTSRPTATRATWTLAAKFYANWGYAPVHSAVPSIAAILRDLAGQSSIDQVTIVSHANPHLMQIQFIDGGPDQVEKSDWQVDTGPELLPWIGTSSRQRCSTR